MGPRIEIEQYRRDFFLSWQNLKWQQMQFGKVIFFYHLLREYFLLFELTLEIYNIYLGFQGFAIVEKK